MEAIATLFREQIGLIMTVATCVIVVSFFRWFFLKRESALGAEKKLPRQLWMLLITIVCVLIVILALPIKEATRGQVLSLLGIVITSIIALSSTTFVANAMAGLMLRMINTFKPGDYIRFDDQLCRVTERGLFHTEVQNEEKDLVTYPNLFLVTNPIRVIQQTGTLISCSLSLGYDISKDKIEQHLIAAAKSIGLETPFVLVKSLGDFSVVYRVSGFLNEVKHLVTWRSNLAKAVLQHLHLAGIEIVSPNFMNTRQFDSQSVFIPKEKKNSLADAPTKSSTVIEEKIFDKAEDAHEKEQLVAERDKLRLQLSDGSVEENTKEWSKLQQQFVEIELKIAQLEQCSQE
ncbi:MAG: mechanosensitive ion channel domain-containing protein [Kangiellaceae bacterium]